MHLTSVGCLEKVNFKMAVCFGAWPIIFYEVLCLIGLM